MRYLSHWTGWTIEEISDYSPQAAIRMLLRHLARIPAEYRRFSSIAIAFLSQIPGSSGPHQETLRSLLSVVVDYAPIVPEVSAHASIEERARHQVRELVGDVWGRLEPETIDDLILAEVAWLQIARKLDKWPNEVPLWRRDCAHNLCCAFERELRNSVRLMLDRLNVKWTEVFDMNKSPSVGEMTWQVFSRESALTPDARARAERIELYRYFSGGNFKKLTQIRHIRNRAAHGADSGETVTLVDVITIRDIMFDKGALAAACLT
jgi:hypothetical protein